MALSLAILAMLPGMAEAQDMVSVQDTRTANQNIDGTTARSDSLDRLVVYPGDSLWSISQERLGPSASPEQIANEVGHTFKLNRERIGDDPNLIFPGQELLLPPVAESAPPEWVAEPRSPRQVSGPTTSEPSFPEPMTEPTTPEQSFSGPQDELTTPETGVLPGPSVAPEPLTNSEPVNTFNFMVMVIVVLITLYVYALVVAARTVKTGRDLGSDELFFVLLVPALNEEEVIAKTLDSLLALHGKFSVLVIDDASDDGTVAAVTPFLDDQRVWLIERPREQARRGKGDVLNHAYAALQELELVKKRYGPENVITVVFDSDTRVKPHFLQAVAPYFRDPKVAGVQSAVRMYNAAQNFLTLWQNLEFAIWGSILCRAKNLLGSASLGGNGQCVRLSALAELGPEPWQTSSLTEDLDLSLQLLRRGWQLRFCPSVAVYQEAVIHLDKLVRQRSRWVQGHLVCWQHLPSLLRSRLPVYTRLDLLVFLLLPAAVLPIGLASLSSWAQFLLYFGQWSVWNVLAWYALGFMAAPLAVVYLKFSGRRSLWQSLLHGHLFAFFSFVWFLAAIAACWNVMLGRRVWAKTSRVATEPEAKLLRPTETSVTNNRREVR